MRYAGERARMKKIGKNNLRLRGEDEDEGLGSLRVFGNCQRGI